MQARPLLLRVATRSNTAPKTKFFLEKTKMTVMSSIPSSQSHSSVTSVSVSKRPFSSKPMTLSDQFPRNPSEFGSANSSGDSISDDQCLPLPWPDYSKMADEKLQSKDPREGADSEPFQVHEEMDFNTEVKQQIIEQQLHRSWADVWRSCPVKTRGAVITEIGRLLKTPDKEKGYLDTLTGLISREMGKSEAEARGEVLKSAGLCEYYGKAATSLPSLLLMVEDEDGIDSDINIINQKNFHSLNLMKLERCETATSGPGTSNLENLPPFAQFSGKQLSAQDSSFNQGEFSDSDAIISPLSLGRNAANVQLKKTISLYNSLTPLQQTLMHFEPETFFPTNSSEDAASLSLLSAAGHKPIPGAEKTIAYYEPLGIVLAVMPWNFPVWQAIRAAIPQLLAGNVFLLKPAPNVLLSGGLVLEKIVQQAMKSQIQAGGQLTVFRTLRCSTNKVGRLISHPLIKGVCLTGSERAGRSVAALAGLCLKKCVVELGGNDCYVILKECVDDENERKRAAEIIVKARLLNMGQSCISPKRVCVVGGEERKKKFEEALIEEFGKKVTNASLPPLVHSAAKNEIVAKIDAAIAHGARKIFGSDSGKNNSDAFLYPTILTDVSPQNPIFDKEIFGPVISILTAAETEKEAIELHNASSFGLGGAVFTGPPAVTSLTEGNNIHETASDTEDLLEGPNCLNSTNSSNPIQLVRDLRTGMLAVNDFVRSDASVPFGGIRNSGLGRECGKEGLVEFTNVKTVSWGARET